MSLNRRIQREDALKHLFECEYRGQAATGESLAGSLGISLEQGSRLLDRLKHKGFICFESTGFSLTDSGRAYALRMVRAHRLLETQLSRETGVNEREWHRLADVDEHKLSDKDLEALAERLGDPRFDPHGDPIPTASGECPEKQGQLLASCAVGWEGAVLHVEDEPQGVYESIVFAGITPGLRIRVIEAQNGEFKIVAEGKELCLSAAAAANIMVGPPRATGEFDESVERLSALSLGEKASVVGLLPSCRGAERNRLLDLGVVPGSVVEADLASLLGSPIAYRIRGTLIALRREQADKVLVRRDRP